MMRFFSLFCLCLIGFLHSKEQTICLNMIVKNENPVIKRCLQSVKPFIDYWVIVDTGSKDGTQATIQEFMKDIPGELFEREWKNFGFNRNEALQLAQGKGDYVLFIDADEVIEGSLDKTTLSQDVYLGTLRLQQDPLMTCQRALLINNHKEWRWQGVIHESLKYEGERSFETLPGIVVSAEATDGHRAQDPKKYLKDAYVLEQALLEDPDNPEYVYYLAQSYYLAKELERSLQCFQKRAQMSGWDQHTFWAKYFTGHIQELLGAEPQEIIRSYSEAYHFRPTRAEPLARLANLFYNQKNYIIGYALAQLGLSIPFPTDIVYVEEWIYSYGLRAIFANCALELGKWGEAATAYEHIVDQPNAPSAVRQQALSTLTFIDEQQSKKELAFKDDP